MKEQLNAVIRQNEQLRLHNFQLDAALDNISDGFCVFDGDERLIVCNKRYLEICNLQKRDVRPGISLRDLIDLRRDAGTLPDMPAADFYAARHAVSASRVPTDSVVKLANGRITAIHYRPMPNGCWVATHQDITERQNLHTQLTDQLEITRKHQEELGTKNLQFDMAINNMSQGLCFFDGDQVLIICNNRYIEMYNLDHGSVYPGVSLGDIIELRYRAGTHPVMPPDKYHAWRNAVAVSSAPTDSVVELMDGRVFAIRHRPMPDGGWVATHEDITERRQFEARIAHMAHHDALTGLANRVLLNERLEQALARARHSDGIALHLLDLDRFKEVNDTLGHPIGDVLLKCVTQRLHGCVREADTIARLGGDEFAIVQTIADEPVEALALARRIRDVIAEPYALEGHHVVIGTSIGIAIGPAHGLTPDQLMKNADLALYKTKSEGGGGLHLFEPEMDRRMQARRNLKQDLRNALGNGEFALHFQPLINIQRNEVCGFEALLRWTHPERGKVSPADFIPLAEETGLIVPIGEWVLRQACLEAAGWPKHLKVAVNLSVAQFKSRHLVDFILGTLAATGVASERLELEITESVMQEDEQAAFTILTRLHDAGIRIALDDFGTGYSSLSNLHKFPFDKIKIDRSFVRDLDLVNALAVVRSVAQLGISLGMSTTAEGVETEGQMEKIRAEGYTEAQGFLFGGAMPAGEIARLYLAESRKPVNAA